MADLEDKEKKQVVLIALPRKLVIAWTVVNFVLFVSILGSYQYANYAVSQLCGVITISLNAYKANPRPSATGRTLAVEFQRLAHKYHC